MPTMSVMTPGCRRDFPKRRGFFFQGEADEGHFSGDLI
jgi:hypothetical protein